MTKLVAIGNNRVDDTSPEYRGWDGALSGCVGDAGGFVAAATRAGCETASYCTDYVGDFDRLMLVAHGTADPLLAAFDAVAAANPGDLHIILVSGHGAQEQQPLGFGYREGLCLFDRIVWDDELWRQIKCVPAGVRLLLITDVCHAAGMIGDRQRRSGPFNRGKSCPVMFRSNVVAPVIDRGGVAGEVAHWSACGKMQTALDGDHNGLFSATALGRLDTTTEYLPWFDAVRSAMPLNQKPEIHFYGRAGVNAWQGRRVFT